MVTHVAALLLAGIVCSADAGEAADGNFDGLHELILPGEDDSQWMQVSWMSATDIWAARKKAAQEGKPILLWYMAGEPLGSC